MFKTQTILFLFFALCLLTLTHSYKVSDFSPSILKPTPASGYYNVETGGETSGQILCFGDINGDQYNDYVAIGGTPNELYVYFWNHQKSEFIQDKLSLEQYKNLIHNISEVMLTDLTSDGNLDIIVTYSQINQTTVYDTIAYSTSSCSISKCSYQRVSGVELKNSTSVPTLINFQGDTAPSFLTFQDNNRYIWNRQSDGKYEKKSFNQYLNSPIDKFNTVQKHFTANIDFNGDCHSDLVILAKNDSNWVLEFYEKQTNSKFTLIKQLNFHEKIVFFTMIDLDATGTIDIVLITIFSTGAQQLQTIPNRYKQISSICQQHQEFPFDIRNLKTIDIAYPISHGIIQFGDIDSDSFPDLLSIVDVNDFRKVVVWKNVQGISGRTFTQSTDKNINQISEIKNPKQIAFFDLGEDGKLDIFIMVEESKSSDGSVVVTRSCFVNNVKDDTLFIKILPLSQSSQYSIGSQNLANAFGITIQWRITKLDGNKKISLLNQKSQWNYGTLQLPFVCGGLGRTNNYVQDLTVGYEGMGQKMSWSPIIPDSKLLVYEKDGDWKLQTLLTNSDRVNHVIYVSVIILFVLGLIILFLNYRQNKQDRKDQYNFIQLIR